MMMNSYNTKTSDPIVGKFNNSSQGIDYSNYCKNDELLTGIKVEWNPDHITCIDLAFNGNAVGAVKGTEGSLQSDVFSLQHGDIITEIYGRFTDHLTCLCIRTHKGQTKTWGNPTTGNSFFFRGDNSYIKALKVRAGKAIEYLEPIYGDATFVFAKKWPLLKDQTDNVGFAVKGTEEFNDWEWVQDKFNIRVSKVSVWGNSNFVTGVQFHYELDGTTKSPGMHMADDDNSSKKVLNNEEGDYIEKVYAKVNPEGLAYIIFITKKGNKLEAGNKNANGEGYLVVAPQDFQIISIRGEMNKVVNKIGVNFGEWY